MNHHPFPQQQLGVCLRGRTCWVCGIRRQKEPMSPSPMRALWALHPVQGWTVSQVMAPWGCLKMPQGWQAGGFHRIVHMFLQRCVKRPLHSWLLHLSSPPECVFSKIYQKTTPPLTPNSPPQQKGPNKKKTSVNDRELPTFQVPCLSLRAAFPSSLIHFTWVLTLSHESICCLTGQFFC
jgi:hypothetical protein